MRRPATAGSSLFIALLGAMAWSAAARSQDAVFSDEIEVEVINLEVVVTDREGEPVMDLGREEFEIFQDGRPVPLTNFLVIDEERLGGTGAQGEAHEEPGIEGLAISAAAPPLSLVIFVDNLNIHPANRKALFEELRDHLEGAMDGRTSAMLVAMNNEIEVVQPMTTDPRAILDRLGELEQRAGLFMTFESERRMFLTQLQRASLESVGSTFSGPAPSGGPSPLRRCPESESDSLRVARNLAGTARSLAEQRYLRTRATALVVNGFSSVLGGLPGRKAMLYLSDGLGQRPADSLLAAWTGKYENWVFENNEIISRCYAGAAADFQRMMTSFGSSEFDLHNEIDRLAESAADSNVALYPISASGRDASLISASVGGSPDGAGGGMMRNAQIMESQQRDASLLQLADVTGGLAYTGSTNLGDLLGRVRTDFSRFYSLGYELPDRQPGSELREVEVKVKREGLTVRHVKGYRLRSWRDRLGEMTAATALLGVESNPHGILLAPAEPVRRAGRHHLSIVVQIPLSRIAMIDTGGGRTAKLTLLAMVRDRKGDFADPVRVDLPIEIPAERLAQLAGQAIGYPLELETRQPAERVAIGLYDHLGRSASCLKLDLEVPETGRKGRKRRKG